MQTLRDSASPTGEARRRGRTRALVAAALAGVMTLSLAGCSATSSLPRLQAQVDDVTTLSTCESAYLTATTGVTGASSGTSDASDTTGTSVASGTSGAFGTSGTTDTPIASGGRTVARPLMMRYLAASAAADAWTTVAAECTGRFAEGTLRSAQASYAAQGLAARLGLPGRSPESVDYGDVVGLGIGSSTLDALSLAEDRAGFITEVLAARKVAGATLAMSDNHKTAAQRLFTLSGSGKDPRKKVYTVGHLLSADGAIDDPANGLRANTTAVAEMNCAREYLDAISSVTDDSASRKTLEWLSKAASARAWRAFTLGYPAFDAALFD